jgi:HEAT repeat protein
MGKAHSLLTSGAVVGLVLLCLWVDGPPEPVFPLPSENVEATYRGQPASLWLTQLQSRDVSFRVIATQALEQIGPKDERVVPALVEVLTDPSEEVRRAAAFAFRRLGSEVKAAVPSLILALKDQDPLVRINAACALASIQPQDEGIIAALTPMLEDDSPTVRRTILRIVRAMDGAAMTAAPAVGNALTNAQTEIHHEASKANVKREGDWQ